MEKKLLKNASSERMRICAGRVDPRSKSPFFDSQIYKRWYVCYVITASLVLLGTLLLLVFGVSASGERLIDSGWGGNFVDKIINGIVDISFGNIDTLREKDDVSIDLGGDKNSNSVDKNPTVDDSQNKTPSSIDDKRENGIYDFDYSLVPEGHTPIIPMDLSLTAYGEKYINNSTGYSPDVLHLAGKELFESSENAIYSPDKPRVLILHTHSTEAYSPEGVLSCESVDSFGRNNDKDKNVVSIGRIIADTLNENQIFAVHCTVMHDSTQYKDSYYRAAETIKKYLQQYPSIELVIDVHRDAVIKSSGEIVKAVSEVHGKAAAQVMCVVGTDFGGEDCPRWEDNLSLALKLRNSLNNDYQNICRPVTLKSSTYNQEFTKYSLLLEIGTSGNSLEEAELAAELVAKAIVDLLK